jgi:hypothetical protein
MTELHPGLELFRDQLRAAIERDLSRRTRTRTLQVAVPMAAAAATAAAVVAFTGGTSVQNADAAILRHVAAALTSPSGTILHERATVTAGSSTYPFELWARSDPPYGYRVHKWGHQGVGSGKTTDPAATLRALVQSGQATVDANTTFDGVPAFKLTVTGASDHWLNGTAYVSKADYHPLQMSTNGESIRFQSYEYLPATAANLALAG